MPRSLSRAPRDISRLNCSMSSWCRARSPLVPSRVRCHDERRERVLRCPGRCHKSPQLAHRPIGTLATLARLLSRELGAILVMAEVLLRWHREHLKRCPSPRRCPRCSTTGELCRARRSRWVVPASTRARGGQARC